MGIIFGLASSASYQSVNEVIHIEYLVPSGECRKHTVNVPYFPGRQ